MAKVKAHFLHIGKTGGTAVKKALEPCIHDGKYDIVLHPHHTRLDNVPVGEEVFFVLRHPFTRFVSGFNSRLRRGRPRYNYPWSQEEKDAFARFKTARNLAEALSDDDEIRRHHAEQAMGAIQHVRDSVWQWFLDPAYFSSRAADVLFVCFQESLKSDFECLANVLGLGGKAALPTDPVEIHQTPSTFDQSISELGKQNLLAYYARDLEFYEEMKKLRAAT